MKEPMKAKIFRNGGSQAVRLPKSCRFSEEQDEVLVKKDGQRVILEPLDEWSRDFLGSLGAWDEEIERPVSRTAAEMKDPFE